MNMGFLDYLGTAVVSTGLIGLGVWAFKNLLITRLTASVTHVYDEKLANITAKLNERGQELDTLRGTVLGGVSERQKVLYSRKLDAVEKMWQNVLNLGPAKVTASMLATIKYKEMLEEGAKNPKIKEMFEAIDLKKDDEYFSIDGGYSTRLYLSDQAWVLFSAYVNILSVNVLRMSALKSGLNSDFMDNSESMLSIVKIALPHQEKYIDEHGIDGFYYLLEELELSIIKELRKIISDKRGDEESLTQQRALNEILKETTEKK